MSTLYKKLVNTIDKFKNDKSIFIYDYSSNTKISYQNFYREYKTLEDKITNLKDDNVYLLNVSNNIKSILLIIAFTLSKKMNTNQCTASMMVANFVVAAKPGIYRLNTSQCGKHQA